MGGVWTTRRVKASMCHSTQKNMKRNHNTRFFLCQIVVWAIAILVMAHASLAQGIPGRWYKVALPQPARIGNDNTMDFSFIDTLNGICLTDKGLISSTSNGGKRWNLDTTIGEFTGVKLNLNSIECTAPHYGFFYSAEQNLSISPSGTSIEPFPNFNEVNWGAYLTLAEKMYDTSYGFRFVELVSTESANQYNDSVLLIVTHDGWQSSSEYGSPYIINPDTTYAELHNQPFNIAYIVDSNNVWAAKGANDVWTGTKTINEAKIVLHTSNGGATWRSFDAFDSVHYQPEVQDFFANSATHEVFSLCSDSSVVDYAYSSDDGATWRLDSTFGPHLWRMANPASGILWAMIGQSGPGWTAADVEIFPPGDIQGAPNDYCRKLGYSSDNGMTWAIDSTTFIDDSLEEIHFLDTRHGWIASWSNDSLFMWYYNAEENSVVNTELQISSGISIFPNPATNKIQISSAEGDISILDPLGRNYPVKQTGNALDISSLPSGVYFIRDGVSRAKFVKE